MRTLKLLFFFFLIVTVILIGLYFVQPHFSPSSVKAVDSEHRQGIRDIEDFISDSTENNPAYIDLDAHAQLDFATLKILIKNLDSDSRRRLLADQDLFRQTIKSEIANNALANVALSNPIIDDDNVRFLLSRHARAFLGQLYIKQKLNTSGLMPEGFPGNDEIMAYYQTNLSQFILPRRVHVWQIFLKRPESHEQLGLVEQKMQTFLRGIQEQHQSFSTLALAHSEHELSRRNGGYMGLINVDDLLPVISERLLTLNIGEISDVVLSEQGVHLLKRGEILPEEIVPVEHVKPQIRALLINQYQQQIRQEILAQASANFPSMIPEDLIEEWFTLLQVDKK